MFRAESIEGRTGDGPINIHRGMEGNCEPSWFEAQIKRGKIQFYDLRGSDIGGPDLAIICCLGVNPQEKEILTKGKIPFISGKEDEIFIVPNMLPKTIEILDNAWHVDL